jgi:hypothetical protein
MRFFFCFLPTRLQPAEMQSSGIRKPVAAHQLRRVTLTMSNFVNPLLPANVSWLVRGRPSPQMVNIDCP